jgi:hypothetical protein
MNTRDYNEIMEFIEGNFVGKNMNVHVTAGDGPDVLTYCGKLEDAFYEVTKTTGRKITVEDAEAGRVPKEEREDLKVKRIDANSQDVRYDVDFIRLKFEGLETKLSGHGLSLGSVRDYSLPNPEESGKYLLCNETDRPLMVYLEEKETKE